MSDIALYNLLKRIPDTTDEEAKEAVGGVASAATKSDIKDMTTKSDIKDMATKSDLRIGLAELETRLTNRMYGMAGIILVGVGLMIKFL